MSEQTKKEEKQNIVWKSYSVGVTSGNNPLLVSVHDIKPIEMRHKRFGGLRVTGDNDHQDAGGDGKDGTDHGD